MIDIQPNPSYIPATRRGGNFCDAAIRSKNIRLQNDTKMYYNINHFMGVTIEFSHLAVRLFNGFETKGGFNLALPEKALLDTIYLRKAIPFRDELNLALLDRRRLDLLANNFPGPTQKLVQELIFPNNDGSTTVV